VQSTVARHRATFGRVAAAPESGRSIDASGPPPAAVAAQIDALRLQRRGESSPRATIRANRFQAPF